MQIFSKKTPAEAIVLTFNFAPDLGALTLSGAPTITVTDANAKDPSPSAILNGAPQLDSTQTQWLVPVKAGIDGAAYLLDIVTQTSSATTVLEIQALLPVGYS
jgi:hypothetical protein